MTREQFIFHVRGCQGSLRRFLAALCGGDTALADDIAQDALLRAYVASEKFAGEGKFRSWLFKIGYNCFINKIKASSLPLSPIDGPAARNTIGGYGADESFRHQELYLALRKIPEKERVVIVLHYFEDLPIKEISKILEIPTGTVKYHLSLGRNHLKEYISYE